jgi:ferredoxin-type protein NapF
VTVSAPKAAGISRRQLFRGDLSGKRVPIRPPWAIAEDAFVIACDRCDDCVHACPERVIRSGSGGFPEMDFSARGCSLCGECVIACRGKALTGNPEYDRPWDSVVEIDGRCLAGKGVVCRSCGEACDASAIRFRLRVGGAAEPQVDAAICTGCGYCIGVCPVQALRITKSPAGQTKKVSA